MAVSEAGEGEKEGDLCVDLGRGAAMDFAGRRKARIFAMRVDLKEAYYEVGYAYIQDRCWGPAMGEPVSRRPSAVSFRPAAGFGRAWHPELGTWSASFLKYLQS